MKKRLIELLNVDMSGCNGDYAEEMADYLLENGVIVPPCKVGDEVYCIVFLPVNGCFAIHKGSVISMRIENENLNIRITDCELVRYANLDITVNSSDFGKTVFLSEAEAEHALKNLWFVVNEV